MTTLAYDRLGTGQTLVLLHPLGADRGVWRPVLDRLASARDCICFDLPGFGESPPLEGSAHPRELAKAVTSAVSALGIEPGSAHFAGNSLGGWVALESALAGAAATVTAIAPAGLWPAPLAPKPEVAHRLARAVRPIAARLMASPRGRARILGGVVTHPERIPPVDATRLLVSYGSAPGFIAVNRAMRAGVFGALAELTVPVTLAWPDHDRLVSRAKRVPEYVRQVELRDCGHIPMWDDPAAVAEVLLAGSSADAAQVPAAGGRPSSR